MGNESRVGLRILVLAAVAAAPVELARAGPGASVDAQRAADEKAYKDAKDSLYRDKHGQWVAIADGKVLAMGTKPEEVMGPGSKSGHRFVFQIGEDGDRREPLSAWYGPRFGGLGVGTALDLEASRGPSDVTLGKAGKEICFKGGPYPRARLRVGAPGGKPETLDAYLATDGPDLVITPEDYERLGLVRFEVPGKVLIGRFAEGRRVLVRVGVEGLAGDAWLVATVPTVSKLRLAELARTRDADFLSDDVDLWDDSKKSLAGSWVLFGVDRVLGSGPDASAALVAGEGKAPEAVHRSLVKLPRGEPLVFKREAFAKEESLVLGGEKVTARGGGEAHPGVYLVDVPTAASLRADLAEEGREVLLQEGAESKPARLAAVWKGPSRLGTAPASPLDPSLLVWVLWPAP